MSAIFASLLATLLRPVQNEGHFIKGLKYGKYLFSLQVFCSCCDTEKFTLHIMLQESVPSKKTRRKKNVDKKMKRRQKMMTTTTTTETTRDKFAIEVGTVFYGYKPTSKTLFNFRDFIYSHDITQCHFLWVSFLFLQLAIYSFYVNSMKSILLNVDPASDSIGKWNSHVGCHPFAISPFGTSR